MRIKYVANGMQRTVRDSVGKALIARRLARAVTETGHLEPEPPEAESIEISPRTGKPKRQYKRRDMRPEE